MQKLFLSVLLLLVFCAIPNLYGAGTTAANFLKIGIGARNIAMGETGANETSVNALYWNPAELGAIEHGEVSFMHTAWLADVSYENAAYAQKFGMGTIGIAAYYLSMPAIDKYDNTGLKLNDTFKPADMALSFSYNRDIGPLPVGVTLKYISSQIDQKTATAYAADIGVAFDNVILKDVEGFKSALVVQNLGTPMKFVNESYPLPFNIKVGASYVAFKNTMFDLDLNKYTDTDLIGNAGAEYLIPIKSNISLALRAGYKTNQQNLGGLAGLTGGLGFEFSALIIDYAFVPYGDLDNTQIISLRYKF